MHGELSRLLSATVKDTEFTSPKTSNRKRRQSPLPSGGAAKQQRRPK
jgi:hypothetical protein